ncbi:MAG TPA: hypothetical protein DCO82_10165 [Alphaproteobacteria bacterium]|nr:hypothetical protein [Alphaproteobacteria bacterium]
MTRSISFWGCLTIVVLIILALTLGGCTTAYPGSPQAHSGITEASVEKTADGAWKGHIISGKNSGRTSLAVTMPDGTAVNFEGEQIDGAAAQAEQAAANAAIMDRLAGSADKLIDKIPAQ